MNPLKKLAGQTALYGVSTILGRVLNYALVPIHTSILTESQFGKMSELYAYVALFNILYTFGMETAYFRFASQKKYQSDQITIFRSALTWVLLISFTVSALLFWQAPTIAQWLGYPEDAHIVRWLAIIMLLDAFVAIPFAQLRLENKAKWFVITKLSNLGLQIGLQLFFLLLLPQLMNPSVWFASEEGVISVSYVFLANLIASLVTPLFLWQWLIKFRPVWDHRFIKPMLAYASPILLMGLAGMINERIDIILFADLLPENFYPDKTSLQALGTYGASVKLSIFMLLAVQAFRYAGEPFFFSGAEDKNAPSLFAQVMHYFTVFSILILVAVSINVELIGTIFLRSEGFRDALYVVPFLLFGKMLYGIYINLSVWFKITDRPIFGTIIASVGAVVTLVVNIGLIPVLGYLGCAVASISCYFIMCSVCYYYGRKYYPIPYFFGPSLTYLIAGIGLIYLSFAVDLTSVLGENGLNIGLTLLFTLIVFLREKKSLQTYSKA
ncbi:oligosaccharide flippase family protein [Tunicatimonas pelagia]|uniref:oligosaccharide flippase family protein n=1 Tax=Tunicatimonas pelagia TaxID=931531 RepID=UPI00266552CD|nr:oligosaccharide flippase family protein [Tunicatimonas pelagia]WKN41466.1 oligosaccharide flippase family protein [Tunicatimonas pelagia]